MCHTWLRSLHHDRSAPLALRTSLRQRYHSGTLTGRSCIPRATKFVGGPLLHEQSPSLSLYCSGHAVRGWLRWPVTPPPRCRAGGGGAERARFRLPWVESLDQLDIPRT
eukprot:6171394-Pleurochrysis_carterae.AAC.1